MRIPVRENINPVFSETMVTRLREVFAGIIESIKEYDNNEIKEVIEFFSAEYHTICCRAIANVLADELNIPAELICVSVGDRKKSRNRFDCVINFDIIKELNKKEVDNTVDLLGMFYPYPGGVNGQDVPIYFNNRTTDVNAKRSVKFGDKQGYGPELSLFLDFSTLFMGRFYITDGKSYTADECVAITLFMISKAFRVWEKMTIDYFRGDLISIKLSPEEATRINKTIDRYDLFPNSHTYPRDIVKCHYNVLSTTATYDGDEGTVLSPSYELTAFRYHQLLEASYRYDYLKPMYTVGAQLDTDPGSHSPSIYSQIWESAIEDLDGMGYDIRAVINHIENGPTSKSSFDTICTTPCLDINIINAYLTLAYIRSNRFPIRAILGDTEDLIQLENAIKSFSLCTSDGIDNEWSYYLNFKRYRDSLENKDTVKARKKIFQYLPQTNNPNESTLEGALYELCSVTKGLVLPYRKNTTDMFTVAEERVMFQKDSSLAKGILKATQDLVAARDEYVKDIPSAYDTKEDMDRMFKYMNKWAQKNYVPAIKSAMEKSKIGITLDNVLLMSSKFITSAFSMKPKFMFKKGKSWEAFAPFVNIKSDPSTDFYLPKLDDRHYNESLVRDQLNIINEAFDAKSSRIRNGKDAVHMDMCISLGDILFMNTYISEDVIQPFTPEEITSVFLHEIGHCMAYAEYADALYAVARVARDTIPYVLRNGSAEQIKTLETSLTSANTTISPVEYRTNTKGVVNTKLGKLIIGSTATAIGLLCSTPVGLCILGGILSYKLYYIMQSWTDHQIRTGMLSRRNEDVEKFSDTVITNNWSRNWERVADEFVSMHGMGAAFASLNLKYDKFFKIMYQQGMSQDTPRNIMDKYRNSVTAATIYYSLGDLLCGPMDRDSVSIFMYGTDTTRRRDIIRDNYNILKDTSIPKELRDMLIVDMQKLLTTMDEYEKHANTVGKKVWDVLDFFIDTYGNTSMKTRFMTGNLEEGYRILQDATNGLIKNPLYYQSARIQKLSDDL